MGIIGNTRTGQDEQDQREGTEQEYERAQQGLQPPAEGIPEDAERGRKVGEALHLPKVGQGR